MYYDVFLSFRGEDTRRGFSTTLFECLSQDKIYTFMDDGELEPGDVISDRLREAIRGSRVFVVVFSKNYASSTWCLEELVHILECGRPVVPIFYDIDPSHVRKQEGSFREHFANLEIRFQGEMEKVSRWREACSTAAGLVGFDSKAARNDVELANKIVKEINRKLNHKSTQSFDRKKSILSGVRVLVGIGDSIEEMKLLLDIGSSGVRIVCIWGMGGIGKTTLARALLREISSNFEASYFLAANGTEEEMYGPKHLKDIPLLKVLRTDDVVRTKLLRTRVLIIVDDVNKASQLDFLEGCCDLLCRGSRIIITTRDRHLLGQLPHVRYKIKELNGDKALELFHLKALGDISPSKEFTKLSRRFVDYCKGIPLALKILGSLLYGRNQIEWEGELNKLKKFPNPQIQDVLKLSYSGLHKLEKKMFLDIACFYKGETRDFAKPLLDDCEATAEASIGVLIHKSLISIADNRLWMHDLIQEMGWAIAHKYNEKPGKPIRLWIDEDVHKFLKSDTGAERVEGISKIIYKLQLPEDLQSLPDHCLRYQWDALPLESLPSNLCDLPSNLRESLPSNLRDIVNPSPENLGGHIPQHWGVVKRVPGTKGPERVEGMSKIEDRMQLPEGPHSLPDSLKYQWDAFPLESLPSNLDLGRSDVVNPSPENLVELIPQSVIKLVPGTKGPERVEGISKIEEPSLSPTVFNRMNSLKLLNLYDVQLPQGLNSLPDSLRYMRWHGYPLKSLPSCFSPANLVELHMPYCKVVKLFTGTKNLRHLRKIDLSFSENLIEVPDLSSSYIIESIDLRCCKRLVQVPSYFRNLERLTHLNLKGCSKIRSLPDIGSKGSNMEFLNLGETAIKELPSSIWSLGKLVSLGIEDCKYLKSLPDGLCMLNSLRICFSLLGCSSLRQLPDELPRHITYLELSGTGIKDLPSSIVNLTGLTKLHMSSCKSLKSVPNSISKLENLLELVVDNCKSLQSLEAPLHLKVLDVHNCKSLMKVTSSEMPQTPQGWDEYKVLSRPEELIFSNCLKLDLNASSIRIDPHRRIMSTAIAVSKLIESGKEIEEADANYESNPIFSMCFPGDDIPKWFSNQTEGSLIRFQLPPDWFRSGFLGFAMCAVIAIPWSAKFLLDKFLGNRLDGLGLGCGIKLKTNDDAVFPERFFCSTRCFFHARANTTLNSNHLFMWYEPPEYWLNGREAWEDWLATNGHIVEASFDFYFKHDMECAVDMCKPMVKKCGITLLYQDERGEEREIRMGGEREKKSEGGVMPAVGRGLLLFFPLFLILFYFFFI